MRVKAKVSFGGQYAMRKDEVCDLPDNPVTRALIEGGFIAEAPEPKKQKKPAEPEAEPEEAKAEPEKQEVNLYRLRKEDLLKLCKEKGIKVGKKATNEELIKALEAQG